MVLQHQQGIIRKSRYPGLAVAEPVGMKESRWVVITALLFVIVVVVVAIALRLGLRDSKPHVRYACKFTYVSHSIDKVSFELAMAHPLEQTQPLTPQAFKDFLVSGAFNSTGIANLGLNSHVYTFDQDQLGRIRSLKTTSQRFEARDAPTIVTSRARNVTPLAVMRYTCAGSLTVRIPTKCVMKSICSWR